MSDELPEILRTVVEVGDETTAVTPARLLLGRAGTSYRTSTQLQLRADHAFARDALADRVELDRPPMDDLVARFGLFEVETRAGDLAEHLARPDLGRRLAPGTAELLRDRCGPEPDVQIVVGDGLSAPAVLAQVPQVLGPLLDECGARGWRLGRPFFVRHCRVGVVNDIGDALGAQNVVLLIGERPGLATAESLSAYLAHRPRPGDTDADRNLISNIHRAGVGGEEAVRRIIALLETFMLLGRSGFTVKESARATPLPGRSDR